MSVESAVAANQFLKLARDEARLLTPLQVMKLVYIAHGWMLGLYNRPLITDRIEAWAYGPVIPSLYQQMKKFGGGSVTEDLPLRGSGKDAALDTTEKNVIEQTMRLYGSSNGIRLSELTHQPGSPWSVTYETGIRNAEISNDLIAEHYRSVYDERSRQAA